jgi:multicomponent K+:H+ antiporter subunit A
MGALLPGLLIRSGRNVAAIVLWNGDILALIGLCLHIPAVMAGEVITAISWLPSDRAECQLPHRRAGPAVRHPDPWDRAADHHLCALLPVAKADPVGQFYTYLMLFQGAMMGIVLSDNILFCWCSGN